MNGLIWVALPTATVGLVVRDGVIATAPPYLRRLIGQDATDAWDNLSDRADALCWIPDPDWLMSTELRGMR